MKIRHRLRAASAASLLCGLFASNAFAVNVSFTELTGVTGGTQAGTGVFKADLSGVGLANILSIQIADNSAGLGGAAGRFSGFDLDAIKLSTANCATAACAASAVGLSVFDFVAGTTFNPGVQRLPADPRLFDTNSFGTAVDNAVATLGSFDGESTTITPFGFLSMGDNGTINFNLTTAVSTAGLFLYIGEVGNNGEVAASSIRVLDNRVPEPGSLALAWLALAGLVMTGRKSRV